jgi:hypothetical protein
MKLFSKLSQNAQKLYKNSMGQNGIFNKITTGTRKLDNSLQRVGNFLLPLSQKVGMGGVLQAGLNEIHNARHYINDEVNNVKNGLERAVKAPISSIHNHNMYG